MVLRSASDAQAVVTRGRAAASAAFFAQGFVFAVILTHLGAFKDQWGIDDLAITVIMFAVALLAAAGSAVAAVLAARAGSGGALRLGLAGLTVAVLVAGLASSFLVFCVALGFYGLALGCVDATTNMQAVACEALQGRSILTSFHGAWSAGGILGALETSGTAALDWSLTVSLLPVAVVPLIAAAAPLLPAMIDGGSPVDPAAGLAAGDTRTVAPRVPWGAMTMLGIAIVLFYVADSATQSWSTIYLRDVLAASATVAPLGYAAYQATSLLSRLAGDQLVRRVGAAAVVRFAAMIGGLGLLTAVLAPNAWVAIIGFGVLGIGIAVVAPLSFAGAGHLAEVDAAGRPVTDAAVRRAMADRIIARVNQFNYLGFVLGGVVTGFVASGSSMRIGFIVPLVGIAAIIPLARVFAARRPRPAPDATGPADRI